MEGLESAHGFLQRRVAGELRLKNTPTLDFRNRTTGGRDFELSRNFIDVKAGEDIVRSTYTWPIAGGQSLEVGAEAARNPLDLLDRGDPRE